MDTFDERKTIITDILTKHTSTLGALLDKSVTKEDHRVLLKKLLLTNNNDTESLLYAFAASNDKNTYAIGEYLIHIERRGINWKAHIVKTNALPSRHKPFSADSIKPFCEETNSGLNIIDVVTGDTGVKWVSVRYGKTEKIDLSHNSYAQNPNAHGIGMSHITDVFNLIQNEYVDINTRVSPLVSKLEQDAAMPDGIMVNIIRASRYMLETRLQTYSVYDGSYLDTDKITGNTKSIHRNRNMFYSIAGDAQQHFINNIRSVVSYKNKENATGKTIKDHINATFTLAEDKTLSMLNALHSQISISDSLEMEL